MNRRAFFAAASLAAVVGCRPRSAGPGTSAADAARIASDKAAREKHLATLADCRVPVGASFTTPKRPVNLLELFPEVKPLQRQTLRLHPRYSDEPAADATKLGGQFCWPADEAWPLCETFKIPYVPVLQLVAADAPTQVKFRPGTDLMQLLWSPRDHGTGGPKPQVMWRKRADVKEPLALPPDTADAFLSYVPVPCRVFPEKVFELPDWPSVPKSSLREKIEGWKPDGGRDPVSFYERELSAAPGTKVGGYPRWLGKPNPAACDTCKRGMDYLLTIDSQEVGREAGWDAPREEKAHPNPSGLSLPGAGNVHVYVCRRCDDWPTKAVG